MRATEKQIRYAMYLLGQKGYSTTWMNANFKSLGATMRERSGRVADWVASMTVSEASQLISKLQAA